MRERGIGWFPPCLEMEIVSLLSSATIENIFIIKLKKWI